MKNRILVLAAHPDDEVLGCGGTIKKLSSKGCVVKVVFFSDGESSRVNKKNIANKILYRKQNAKKAAKILGYNKQDFLNYPDNKFYSVDYLELIKVIEQKIVEFKPDKIFTHFYNDLNVDHCLISKATTTACRPAKFKFVKELFFFHVLSSTDWNFASNNNFKANYFVDISKHFKFKYRAMKCYKLEIEKKHPRSLASLRSHSQYCGSLIGVDFAEPFVLGFSKK